MEHHVDPIVGKPVEPMRLDDLVALVHERRRVDRDLRAHAPRWVPERVLRRHPGERLERDVAERAPGCGQRDAAHRRELLPRHALPERVVLAVDGTEPLPRSAGEPADEVAGGDQHLLVREGNSLAVLEGGDRRPQGGDAGRRDEHEIGVGIGRERGERGGSQSGARGRELHRELGEHVGVAIRAERDDLQAIGVRAHHVEGLPSDGPRRAEDREPDALGHRAIIPERPCSNRARRARSRGLRPPGANRSGRASRRAREAAFRSP